MINETTVCYKEVRNYLKYNDETRQTCFEEYENEHKAKKYDQQDVKSKMEDPLNKQNNSKLFINCEGCCLWKNKGSMSVTLK